jgi:hypothetical protein
LIKSAYTTDLADVIIDDYTSLGRNGITSVVLGIFNYNGIYLISSEFAIATLSMPISFFITFMVLELSWYDDEFYGELFSDLLVWYGYWYGDCFRWSQPERIWKNDTIQHLLFSSPCIRTLDQISLLHLINIVVFIPMLVLPGIVGKFLSFIPITCIRDVTGFSLSCLDCQWSIVCKIQQKTWPTIITMMSTTNPLAIMSPEEKEILYHEREGKQSVPLSDAPMA